MMTQPEENFLDEIIAKIQSVIFKDGSLSFEEEEWLNRYGSVFSRLAKRGFPQINYTNYKSTEYYAYTHAVMDLMTRNTRKNTIDIMVEARKLADLKYGDKKTWGDVALLAHDSSQIFSPQVFNLSQALLEITQPNLSASLLPTREPRKPFFSSIKQKFSNLTAKHISPIIKTATNGFKTFTTKIKNMVKSVPNIGKKVNNAFVSLKQNSLDVWNYITKSPMTVQPVRAVKRYGLATLMFVSSIAGGKTLPNAENNLLNDKQKTTMMIPNTQRTVEIRNEGIYNGVRLQNLQNMYPEDICMVFMSSNRINAKAGGQTIQTATEFGPMLTKMSILKAFFTANSDKYADIQKVIKDKGINSEAFEKAWLKNYSADLMHDIVKYSWEKQYQPTFDKLAQNGFPQITYQNYASPEYFGYSAAVISTLGQASSKTTVEVMMKAQGQAKQNLGQQTTLDDIVDASFMIKAQKWGLKTRYFGRSNSGGELALNQDVRRAQQQKVQTHRQHQNSLSNDADKITEIFEIDTNIPTAINVRESTAIPAADTIYKDSLQIKLTDDKNTDHPSESHDLSGLLNIPNQSQTLPDFTTNIENNLWSAQDWKKITDLLKEYNIEWSDTVSLNYGRAKLQAEKEQLQSQLTTISHGVYKGLDLDFSQLEPENAGHVYEALLNPIIKDSKSIYTTNAMGLYQFNMNNTMKSLANELADEFPALKAAKDKNGGCRNPEYEAAWIKYSTGPNRARFERRQFEFMFDKFYQSVFDNLSRSCQLPQITKDNYNNPEYWAYTASVMSLINQNPRRSTGMMEQAYRQACAQTKTNQPDLALVASISYNVRANQWRYLSSRYLGSRNDKGEKDLVEKVDIYLRQMPHIEQRLAQIDQIIYAVDLAQNRVASPLMFFAAADKFYECESIRLKDDIMLQVDRLTYMEQQAKNIQELRQVRIQKRSTIKQYFNDDDDQAAIQMRQSGRSSDYVLRI